MHLHSQFHVSSGKFLALFRKVSSTRSPTLTPAEQRVFLSIRLKESRFIQSMLSSKWLKHERQERFSLRAVATTTGAVLTNRGES